VKKSHLMVLLVPLILMAGCISTDERVEPSITEIAVAELTASPEPTNISPTNTPQTAPIETAIAEQPDSDEKEIVPEPNETLALEPPQIPCDGTLTSANQEGPYYSQGSPQRASLVEEGMPGVPVLILGSVFNQDCEPIPGAKVDFWQADANGEYDNVGFRLRGYVFTDQNGSYNIQTIEPGLYTGRPPHIHVKVFDPDGTELLTTQLYFPGSENSADVNAAPDLLVSYLEPDENGRQRVLFNFLVQQ
jgi:protocatechuate 3,4-dioxygenase beta subunit